MSEYCFHSRTTLVLQKRMGNLKATVSKRSAMIQTAPINIDVTKGCDPTNATKKFALQGKMPHRYCWDREGWSTPQFIFIHSIEGRTLSETVHCEQPCLLPYPTRPVPYTCPTAPPRQGISLPISCAGRTAVDSPVRVEAKMATGFWTDPCRPGSDLCPSPD